MENPLWVRPWCRASKEVLRCFWFREAVRGIFRARGFASWFSNRFIVTLVKKTVSR